MFACLIAPDFFHAEVLKHIDGIDCKKLVLTDNSSVKIYIKNDVVVSVEKLHNIKSKVEYDIILAEYLSALTGNFQDKIDSSKLRIAQEKTKTNLSEKNARHSFWYTQRTSKEKLHNQSV